MQQAVVEHDGITRLAVEDYGIEALLVLVDLRLYEAIPFLAVVAPILPV